ncbi:MAG: glycosyltransferase family A protein [Candidatus Roizmanbacteria bacterium]
MNTRKTISVIIPVHNEEKFIGRCLDSLDSQVDKPDEIIIIDNHCTDKTIEIAHTHNVKVIFEITRGITPTRNAGFDFATSDVICRCDADCVLPSDWIKKIRTRFEKEDIDALGGNASFFDFPFKMGLYIKLYLWSSRIIFGHNILLGPNMSLTKEIWNRVKPHICMNDKKVHEDLDLSIHLNEVGAEIAYDTNHTVYISARRIKYKPWSFFIEYPYRMLTTLHYHKIIGKINRILYKRRKK